MPLSVSTRWPAFVLPKKDELLSSWLLRNSHAHQMKAHTFCKVVWPRLAFWNRDIDRMALPEVWQLMALKVGVSPERSYQTTLAAYEGILFKRASFQGNSFWLLALGIYHRTHTRYGIQFCPSCFQQDGARPYYRRWWRLALAVGCPECGCQLLDECPFCKQPVVFHRSEIGRKRELATYPLSCCTSCFADFADLRTEVVPPLVLRFQQEWYQRITDSRDTGNGYEYFDVLHQLLMLLSSRKPSLLGFQRAVAESLQLMFHQPAGGYRNRLETLRLEERMRLVEQVAWLLEEWPSRLLDVIRQTNTRLSSILSESHHLPESFVALILTLNADLNKSSVQKISGPTQGV
ncbi:MAG TPA: TniQ family protein [Hymenobacter sp.]|uniref:TniQ family protein n=1 Tax=Hymenobacter sp. TaxID=1898978 RepID=UPI002D805354|nr:TniQ family protein [Hymenobacter sp.]HET9504243.1 TniQ family protein [Hymenobacter sp.]